MPATKVVMETSLGTIELELDGDNVDEARAKLEPICKDLLSNPVIEDYVLTLQPANGT